MAIRATQVIPERTALTPAHVVERVRAVAGPGPVALHEPFFGGREWEYVKACLDSGYVSSVGKFVDRFEAEIAAFTGARHAVAVVNGTAALHVALVLAGVGQGDEVLLPALTFVATANAVVYCGAVPHFADSEESRPGLDPGALREYLRSAGEIRGGRCFNRMTGRVIRAVVPMHVFGHPIAIDELLAVARDYHLVVVEDAAESLGSLYSGKHTGRFGELGTLSFNGNKIITTGGGGAIITDSPELAAKAKHLTTTAKAPHRWEYRHDELGYNYRMPNVNAALGCAQLEQMSSLIEAKRALYAKYSEAMSDLAGCRLLREPEGCRSNYWLQALILDAEHSARRDAILEATNDVGLTTRPVWELLHRTPRFSDCPRMPLPAATSLAARVINLPSSAQLAGPIT